MQVEEVLHLVEMGLLFEARRICDYRRSHVL
jgi:hypothetical protein